MGVEQLFLNPELTIAAFFGVWVGLWLPIAIPLAIVLKWHPQRPPTMQQKLPLVASLYVIAPLVLWGFAHLQQQSFSVYGLTWNPRILIAILGGFSIAVLGLFILYGLLKILGWLVWDSEQVPSLLAALPPTLGIAVWISITEELVFRGFLLNQLQRDYSLAIAAIISSAIFAVLHLVWDGKEALPQLLGLGLLGMILVLARWLDSGSLGLAIGLHAGWVWGIASLDTAQILDYPNHSLKWVTGNGKPLAGIFGILLLLITGAMMWAIATQ
ncbi:CPBP family intramembrane metalloprotease [Phormidium sp. CLA17]|uniref:CPBP family glutamic-type intramembrane protease n=1 Tax=Leptolyngbya sp. Cla-17 TaxID=2803751 RepID=UPI0018D8FB0F|nr:CPBP family glutamic-type intramembrane protease [Leptolyngbya sp. Cla-17]MBM0743253.1 CPBP family intramembrane metalloprotease [Leptolyngbya sp. Cla-17]